MKMNWAWVLVGLFGFFLLLSSFHLVNLGSGSVVGEPNLLPPTGATFVLTDFSSTQFKGVSEISFDDGQATTFKHYVTVDNKVVGDFSNDSFCYSNKVTSSGTDLSSQICESQVVNNQCVTLNKSGGQIVVPCLSSYETTVLLPVLSNGTHVIGVYRLDNFGYTNASVYPNHDVVLGKACRGGGYACQAAPFCRDDAIDPVKPSFVGEVVTDPVSGGNVVCHDAGVNMKGCPSLCDPSFQGGIYANPLQGFVKMAEFSVSVGGSSPPVAVEPPVTPPVSPPITQPIPMPQPQSPLPNLGSPNTFLVVLAVMMVIGAVYFIVLRK